MPRQGGRQSTRIRNNQSQTTSEQSKTDLIVDTIPDNEQEIMSPRVPRGQVVSSSGRRRFTEQPAVQRPDASEDHEEVQEDQTALKTTDEGLEEYYKTTLAATLKSLTVDNVTPELDGYLFATGPWYSKDSWKDMPALSLIFITRPEIAQRLAECRLLECIPLDNPHDITKLGHRECETNAGNCVIDAYSGFVCRCMLKYYSQISLPFDVHKTMVLLHSFARYEQSIGSASLTATELLLYNEFTKKGVAPFFGGLYQLLFSSDCLSIDNFNEAYRKADSNVLYTNLVGTAPEVGVLFQLVGRTLDQGIEFIDKVPLIFCYNGGLHYYINAVCVMSREVCEVDPCLPALVLREYQAQDGVMYSKPTPKALVVGSTSGTKANDSVAPTVVDTTYGGDAPVGDIIATSKTFLSPPVDIPAAHQSKRVQVHGNPATYSSGSEDESSGGQPTPPTDDSPLDKGVKSILKKLLSEIERLNDLVRMQEGTILGMKADLAVLIKDRPLNIARHNDIMEKVDALDSTLGIAISQKGYEALKDEQRVNRVFFGEGKKSDSHADTAQTLEPQSHGKKRKKSSLPEASAKGAKTSAEDKLHVSVMERLDQARLSEDERKKLYKDLKHLLDLYQHDAGKTLSAATLQFPDPRERAKVILTNAKNAFLKM